MVEIKVPEVGESITQVEIGRWLKNQGDFVSTDEPLVEIESDKATIEVTSPTTGILLEIKKQSGETAKIGEILAIISEQKTSTLLSQNESYKRAPSQPIEQKTKEDQRPTSAPVVMPSAEHLMQVHHITPEETIPTGPGERILKEDVLRAIANKTNLRKTEELHPKTSRTETTQRMSPIRRTIARRLLEAQQTAALLTTFNEIDMSALQNLRNDIQEEFQKRHGVKLGIMSFFIRACARALLEIPEINSQIRGDQIVRFEYCDIGVAIGVGKGLVVPIIRNAESLSFAEIEKTIADFASRAKQNKIKLEELEGGTFSITNGGVFGSLLSTPIINPPQSAILGLHAIQERPIALNGEIVVRPMMYVALTYDHRLIDGREAVTFLRRVKELIEKPIVLFDF